MRRDPSLLIVGGAGRNVGKTEFVCSLISRFAEGFSVYGLKVSAIFPDEELYHGSHQGEQMAASLFEERNRQTTKDTSRMLRAGAERVYYLQGDETDIAIKYDAFRRLVPEKSLIICESNSLGEIVAPGLWVIVRHQHYAVKPRAMNLLNRADLVVESDGVSGFSQLQYIHFSPELGWYLAP